MKCVLEEIPDVAGRQAVLRSALSKNCGRTLGHAATLFSKESFFTAGIKKKEKASVNTLLLSSASIGRAHTTTHHTVPDVIGHAATAQP